MALLAARAMRAFHDYMPTRLHPLEQDRIYTQLSPTARRWKCSGSTCAPIAARTARACRPSSARESRIFGERQLPWLMQALKDIRATWKVIACDMPIGLIVWDDFRKKKGAEAVAQGDMGPPKGRELEFAELFRFIRDQKIRNVVWLTADVHYTAAHRYDPNRAQFQEFAPFWEFVSGPAQCGHLRPQRARRDVRPRGRVREGAARPARSTCRPRRGCSSSARSTSTAATDVMTVRLKDMAGATLFTQELAPEV